MKASWLSLRPKLYYGFISLDVNRNIPFSVIGKIGVQCDGKSKGLTSLKLCIDSLLKGVYPLWLEVSPRI